ncbi:similar to Saccharomyces cerevisiae YBR169C SSE2 Member of the heat shock protein 70 (HSP70) family [Maudiozyma saulgeensis]|uniref:Similar to Saccharomyces cerevisiae YBR169C SSE2 Member of the heat shock protein 70 (HSP70) family n=1 Tax=Maudiozyma saulgeensis TaxID=1789683 RepID=A0A1X7R6V0_9SACH|nr:similar to Saccharomyces cerevisiae YBR169C SSE2 Member of the heat shock protein 70 (HSP70) family [Kazachstania saulgeensis]
MSFPVGIDFGNMHSVIAVARNNGVDILINDVSNRSTPSIVGFGEKQRYIGEDGKTKQTSNVLNTADNLQTLLGLRFGTTDFDREKMYMNESLIEYSDDFVGIEVNYAGALQQFSSTQLVATYLNHLKTIALNDMKSEIKDICISIPLWYNEEKRVALMDACKIAGLSNVTLVDCLTAAAVFYGLTKPDLPELKQKAKIVGFFDSGHATTSFAIAAFHQGKLKILSSAFVKGLGGRDFDRAITEYMAELFVNKYKIDIRQNKKAYFRVMTQAEKLKKVLSVNQSGQLNIECLMDDIDVSAELSREKFEELISPIIVKKLEQCIALTFKRAHVESLDALELLGGSTRVPLVKRLIEEHTGIKLSSTLNQDEAAVKGAALIAAKYSSTVALKPIKFRNILAENITLYWDNPIPGGHDSLEVFSKVTHYPITKSTVVEVSSDFTLAAHNGKRHLMKKSISEINHNLLGLWKISGIDPKKHKGKKSEKIYVELILSCDVSKFLHIDDAYVIAKDSNHSNDKEKGHPNYKRIERLKVETLPISKNQDKIVKWSQLETIMIKQDQLVKDTEEMKNELESSIYSLRSKVEGVYAELLRSKEKDYVLNLLDETENWLYDEGEDATIKEYNSKYQKIKQLSNEISTRQ